MNFMEGAYDEPYTQDDLKDKGIEEVEEIKSEKDGEALMILKESTPTVKNKCLQENIFHSTCTVEGQSCIVVIDRVSCENIISQSLVDRLKLKI